MARDSAVGRERILVVPSSLALDNTITNQHVTGAQNDLNQQILEVMIFLYGSSIDTHQYQIKRSIKTNAWNLKRRFHEI